MHKLPIGGINQPPMTGLARDEPLLHGFVDPSKTIQSLIARHFAINGGVADTAYTHGFPYFENFVRLGF